MDVGVAGRRLARFEARSLFLPRRAKARVRRCSTNMMAWEGALQAGGIGKLDMTAKQTRRRFLYGLGGTTIAAPLLTSLVGRSARGQQGSEAPKRFIAMFTHYGCITNNWFPTKSHGPLEGADLMSTSLAPLAPYASKILIPRGIRSMNEWTARMVRGQGNDSHTPPRSRRRRTSVSRVGATAGSSWVPA